MLNKSYKVEHYMDNEYQVMIVEEGGYMENDIEYVEFQGSISECESYINLKERGYID